MGIIEFEIDLKGVNSYIEGQDELGVIKRGLRKRKLYGKTFLYTGFNGLRIPKLKKGKNYCKKQDSIFAFTSENLRWEKVSPKEKGLRDYCEGNLVPAIAIWKRINFYQDYMCTSYEYKFKKEKDVKSSLVGIAKLL